MLGQLVDEDILDKVLLYLTETHNTNTSLREFRILQAAHHLIHNSTSLSGIRACMTLVILTFYLYQTHLRLLVIHAGEGMQLTIIILQVREGYQRLMLRTVMPREIMPRHGKCDTVVENTIHIINLHLVLVHRLRGKEARGRHLLRVAHTDQRLTTGNSTNGLACRHL